MDKKTTYSLVGAILVIFGIVMLFKCVRIYSFGFFRLGGSVSTGGILIALLVLDVILYIATENRIAKLLIPILLALLVLMLILGTHFGFSASLLDFLLILIPIAVGAGLLLRTFFGKGNS